MDNSVMARINSLYDYSRERLLQATLNWATLNLIMTAWSSDPETSFNPVHITQGNLGTPLATSQPILAPNVRTGGYAASSAVEFLTIPMGTPVQFFALCEADATPANRKLLAFLADVEGLPFQPNGLGYLVKPDWVFNQGWWRA